MGSFGVALRGLCAVARPRGFSRRGERTVAAHSFSTVLSPPSKAVVYEHHGPPDQVTRYYPRSSLTSDNEFRSLSMSVFERDRLWLLFLS